MLHLSPALLHSLLQCKSRAKIHWLYFCFTKSCLYFIFSLSLPQIRGPQNQELVQEVDPPPIAHLHSHALKPEPQEVVLRSIMSGQINYSPFEKCTFLSSPIFPSSLSPPSLSSSLHLLFSFQVLQRGAVKETKSSATCVISKRAAFRLEMSRCCGCTGPKIPGNILLRCSPKTCGIPAHSIPTTLLWNFLNGRKAGLFELF